MRFIISIVSESGALAAFSPAAGAIVAVAACCSNSRQRCIANSTRSISARFSITSTAINVATPEKSTASMNSRFPHKAANASKTKLKKCCC